MTNKHSEVKAAYKKGATIQVKDNSVSCSKETWNDWKAIYGEPSWAEDIEYRIKPENTEKKTRKQTDKKITTSDCKKFLVDCFTKDPNLAKGRVHTDDLARALKDSLNEKKWKREAKIDPNKDNDYGDAGDNWGMHYGGSISGTKLKSVRRMILNPNEFDDAIQWMVLETTEGKLILGEDFGD